MRGTGDRNMSNDPVSIARRIAAELRAHPDHWGQEMVAQDSTGEEVEYDEPTAVRWCLMGLVQKHSGGRGAEALFQEAVLGKNQSFAEFNDSPSTTVDDVIALCESLLGPGL